MEDSNLIARLMEANKFTFASIAEPEWDHKAAAREADTAEKATIAGYKAAKASATAKPEKTTHRQWGDVPGLVGEIAYWFWQQSPYPMPEISIGSAIAYVAGIAGRAYNVRGLGLNQYVMLLAESGFGKNAGSKGIDALNAAVHRSLSETETTRSGPRGLPSQEGLTRALVAKPCCVSVVGEIGKWLQKLYCKQPNATNDGLQQIMLHLYTASGGSSVFGDIQYSKSENNVPRIMAPAWSLLGDSTQSSFNQSINETSIEEGLIGRMTFFEYPTTEPVPVFNKDHWKYRKPPAELVQKVVELIKHCTAKENTEDGTQEYNWFDIPMTSDAAAIDDCLEQILHKTKEQSRLEGEANLVCIWMRVRERTLKLAALLAVGIDYKTPVITGEEMNLAYNYIKRGNDILAAKIINGTTGNNLAIQQSQALDKCLQSYIMTEHTAMFEKNYGVNVVMHSRGIITYDYIRKQVSRRKCFADAYNPVAALSSIVREYVDSGRLREVGNSDESRGSATSLVNRYRSGKMYFIERV